MKYQKPEVVLSVDALSAIESHIKPVGLVDNPDTNPQKTSTAYEVDE